MPTLKRNVKDTSSKNQEPVAIQLDVETLNTMCKFIISESLYVKRYDLLQMRRFIDIVDIDKIAKCSPDQADRLKFIQLGLVARLDKKINSTSAVLGFINSHFDGSTDFLGTQPLSRDDINWVNQTTAEMLKYDFLYKKMNDVRSLVNEFSQTTIGKRGDIIDRFQNMMSYMNNEFRKRDAEDVNEAIFSLNGERFTSMVSDAYNKARSVSRRLWCGMQGVNQLTGGFESGRVYMLFGTTGVGKSVTLLNLMYQIRMFNKNYKPKDPTKRPCIVMLTMENTMQETITRLFDLVNKDGKAIDQYENVDEVLDILRRDGNLTLSDEYPIDLVIKYKPNRSVATDYLYTLYDQLSDSGYEPVCLIQDHIKRIRPVEDNAKDIRIALGNAVNEFKTFASLKDIPVITDSHINRDGTSIIENGSSNSKADITRMLGAKNVGESMLMLDNLDMGIIINKEWDRENNMYMVFSVIKKRVRNTRDYIAQPFVPGSEIRLATDMGNPVPIFRETLRSMGNLVHYDTTIRANAYSNIVDTSETVENMNNEEENEDNIFASYTNNDDSNSYFVNDFTPLTSDIPKEEETPAPTEPVVEKKRKDIVPFIFVKNTDVEEDLMNELDMLA